MDVLTDTTNCFRQGRIYRRATRVPLDMAQTCRALRLDYNNIINNVAVSRRGGGGSNLNRDRMSCITFNRAFDAPTSLEQFLILANGQIPNGINIRGIGNLYGYNIP
jgi:hypothetical protein